MATGAANIPRADAEELSILSTMMHHNELIGQVLENLSDDDFLKEAHKKIFRAIDAIHTNALVPDLLTVCGWLREHYPADKLSAYASDVFDAAVAVNISSCIEKIKQAAHRRRAITAAEVVLKSCGGDWKHFDAACDESKKAFEAYVPKSKSKRGLTGDELMGMQFRDPKWALPGLIPEGLSILAGKPKKGKSLLALNILIAITCDEEKSEEK